MLPIEPLMVEHLLIERMVALMQKELTRIGDNVAVDPEFAFVDGVFIDTAVDFLRTYADRCHHGKEEDILFAALAKKGLTPKHKQLLEELKAEHVRGRETVSKLLTAKNSHLREQEGALKEILQYLGELIEFYHRHIKKEETEFFYPCMGYFSDREKAEILQKMGEFDRKLIHEKYENLLAQIETRRSCRI